MTETAAFNQRPRKSRSAQDPGVLKNVLPSHAPWFAAVET